MKTGMKVIYLSGPMTGLPGLNFPAFHEAAARLRACGYQVVSPAEIEIEPGADWQACMRRCVQALCDCTGVALLPCWQKSSGAHLEVHLAHRLGLDVDTVDEWERQGVR